MIYFSSKTLKLCLRKPTKAYLLIFASVKRIFPPRELNYQPSGIEN